MKYFGSFTGRVTMISDFWTGNEQTLGCYKLMTIVDGYGGIVNFFRCFFPWNLYYLETSTYPWTHK